MIAGSTATWLRSRREELNYRFHAAHLRFPALDAQQVLFLVEEIIQPLAEDEPAADELCLTVYDLILRHSARDAFALKPGIGILMREAFPELRHVLLQSPHSLPGSLSNAVENLGPKGPEFSRRLGKIGQQITTPQNLLDAGAVLAWRLGEARLRKQAILAARSLPPTAMLQALDLADWPPAAAPLALACLESDTWQLPSSRISRQTLEDLAANRKTSDQLVHMLLLPAEIPLAEWRLAGSVGDFVGFGGSFERPPLILNGGDRHIFLVRSEQGFFRIAADCFGWVCRQVADPGLEMLVPQAGTVWSQLKRLAGKDDSVSLSSEGVLTLAGDRTHFEELRGATSFVRQSQMVAATTADSYRVRVLTPRRPPL